MCIPALALKLYPDNMIQCQRMPPHSTAISEALRGPNGDNKLIHMGCLTFHCEVDPARIKPSDFTFDRDIKLSNNLHVANLSGFITGASSSGTTRSSIPRLLGQKNAVHT